MHLEKKPDLEKVLERFEAWWHREIIDRPPVTIRVKPGREEARLPEKRHATLRDRWFDVEHALEQFEARLTDAGFVGDTFPWFEPTLGPEICATVFGCELEFGETTSWSIPVVGSCRDILKIQPNLDNVYWQAIRHATELSLERGGGKWITGLPDLHTNGDLVASLRDPEQMCLDCADDIASVREACEYVTDSFPLMYDDLWERISSAGQPTTLWTPLLHAGRAYVTSCDFICLISPAMFEEAILPSIVREMRYLERNIFHLDGPGALQHLDTLLALDELDGLQWVYGAGNGPAARWIDLYKRVQSAGKCLQLPCENTRDAKAVAEHLKPEGVWFCPQGSYPREEAEDFIRWAADWAAGKATARN